MLELQTRLETLGRSTDFLDGIPGAKRPRQSDRKQGGSNTQRPASGAAAAGAELTDFNRAAEAAKQDSYLVCSKQSPNSPNFTALNVARVTIGYPPSVLALSRLASIHVSDCPGAGSKPSYSIRVDSLGSSGT